MSILVLLSVNGGLELEVRWGEKDCLDMALNFYNRYYLIFLIYRYYSNFHTLYHVSAIFITYVQ